MGARETDQQLKALPAFVETPNSVSKTHMEADNHHTSSCEGSTTLFWPQQTRDTHTFMQGKHTYTENKNKYF